MAIQTVAVTGGMGLIGQAVLTELREAGYTTVSLDRTDPRHAESADNTPDLAADEALEVDLLDAGEVYGALASSDADAVVHLGTLRSPMHHPGHVTYESNVMTSYNVLEAATELALEAACLASSINAMGSSFQSTTSVFATGDPIEVDYLPVDEEHPLTPRDPYAVSKQALEITADGFGRLDHGPDAISTIRFPWVARTSELMERLVDADRSLTRVLDAAPPDGAGVPVGRDDLYAYLHLDDAARIARRAIEADFDGNERFWAVARDTSVDAPTAELVGRAFPNARTTRAIDGHESLVTCEKARDLLGWEPQVSWRDL
jgi:nucleoside-diphosphate-sugar epimerase